jgi:hypothetical protein
MTLKPKSSRLLEISSAGVSVGKVRDYCLYWLFGIRGEDKTVDIIFVQVEFHG